MRHLNKLVARGWIRTQDIRRKSHLLFTTLIHSWWPIHGKFQQRYLEYKLGLIKKYALATTENLGLVVILGHTLQFISLSLICPLGLN